MPKVFQAYMFVGPWSMHIKLPLYCSYARRPADRKYLLIVLLFKTMKLLLDLIDQKSCLEWLSHFALCQIHFIFIIMTVFEKKSRWACVCHMTSTAVYDHYCKNCATQKLMLVIYKPTSWFNSDLLYCTVVVYAQRFPVRHFWCTEFQFYPKEVVHNLVLVITVALITTRQVVWLLVLCAMSDFATVFADLSTYFGV